MISTPDFEILSRPSPSDNVLIDNALIDNEWSGSRLSGNEPDRFARPMLVGFPFSGSGTALFGNWRRHLPTGFSLAAAALPAREQRLGETPWSDMQAAADQLAMSWQQSFPRDQVIIPVGFSIGAVLAFEVTRRLVDAGYAVPLLVVASRVGPDLETPRVGFADMDDETFLRVLSDEFNAIPPEIAANEELRSLLLPALRGDLEMGETYRYHLDARLPCDVLAAHGSDDASVRLQWLHGWSKVGQDFRARTFAGGHFFVRDQLKAFLSTVAVRYRAATQAAVA
ncbi:MAG: thioesterase domain-containing protein [Planctomycetota bacterium]